LIQFIVAIGLAWVLLRKGDDKPDVEPDVEPDITPTHDPTYVQPIQPEADETKEAVYTSSNGERVVWKIGVPVYQKTYEDYETSQVFTWNVTYEYHYQIGNADGTSFSSEAVSGGGPNVPAGDRTRITTYSTKQAAIDRILEEEETDAEEECEEGYTYDRILKRCVRNAPPPPDNSRPPTPGFGGGYTNLSSGGL
tara:strand:+ start:7973 stop:8557 length:585 start_codon:yes stop_codon:yes gene_type:complete